MILGMTLWLLLAAQDEAFLWKHLDTVVECQSFSALKIVEAKDGTIYHIRQNRLKCGGEVYKVESLDISGQSGKISLLVKGYDAQTGLFTLKPMMMAESVKVSRMP